MGKGQKLRREQEAAAASVGKPGVPPPAPLGGGRLNATASTFVPGNFMMQQPPAAPAVGAPASPVIVTPAPVKKVTLFQQPDGIEQFLAMEETERMNIVDELLVPMSMPSPPPSDLKTGAPTGGMKSSTSMQSLSSSVGGMKLSTSSNSLKQTKSSTSLNDMSKETDTSLIESTVLDLTTIIKTCGLNSVEGAHIMKGMSEQILSDSSDKGLLLLKTLLKILGRVVEPYAFPLMPRIFALHTDRSASARTFAADIVDIMAEIMCPYSIYPLYDMLEQALGEGVDYRIKLAALQMLKNISPRVTGLISALLPKIIPLVSECIIDTRKQLQTLGMETLTAACMAISNEDIVPLVPQLIKVIGFPNETPATLDMLLETTFVATIDAPTLALIAPLLGKALKGRQSPLKRKAARVIENMCRLVNDPANVAPFMPLLLPALNKVIDEIADEEVCQVAIAARDVLMKAMGSVETDKESGESHMVVKNSLGVSFEELKQVVANTLEATLAQEKENHQLSFPEHRVYQEYIINCTSYLISYYASQAVAGLSAGEGKEGEGYEAWRVAVSTTPKDSWKDCTASFLMAFLPKDKQEEDSEPVLALSQAFRTLSLGSVPDAQDIDDTDETNLCNIYFSLAFGGKTLLHNTYLRLGRGRKYGIMGKNGTGKTTLLTNIASGNIEGLPSTLRTVYVQHDDPSDDHGVGMLDELIANKNIIEVGVTREEATTALKGINFTDEMLATPRNSLSGGWKMKLLIIRAVLLKADVLLLDEPTNHLDAASVQWLADYLKSSNVTAMIVSHDIGFLDQVVTDVIHYETRKLVYYHGNLTSFVKIHPEAKYYYDLESSPLKFVFPVPERLDGINSTTKAILKLDDVTFTYPGASQPTIRNANVKLCLGSRVGILGPNGAGKSTLIKLIVKETEPDKNPDGSSCGEVWKHHNLRIAYVAQHSLHHVEKHLDKSPVDYIKWRFEKGVDKEDMAKSSMSFSEEEMETIKAERQYGDVLEIFGRRKNGKTMEYECSFVGQTSFEENIYVAMEDLVAKGYEKLVQQADARIAAMAAGIDVRPLLTKEIQKHLDDFNLEAEFGTHSTIRRLSGGQKVKLVLAAAMWNRPHIIVLDEPTNYLDREALGALTQAIKAFNGGIVIISHNAEFANTLCTEKWNVKDGIVSVEGDVEEKSLKATSSRKIKAENNKASEKPKVDNSKVGNINSIILNSEKLKNPKTFEWLTPVLTRKLTKLAQAAGVPLNEYVARLTPSSPEWKWL